MINEYYNLQLEQLQKEGMYRQMTMMDSAPDRVAIVAGVRKLVFCSNNYLGLANHPRIIKAAKTALDKWGFGAGASRLICGHQAPHEQLQKRLAGLFDKQAALVMPSGYAVNTAVLNTLAQQGDLIAIDKLVHASIIDGATASPGQVRAWGHRQTDKLKRLLEKGDYKRVFIVTDSLFSMDGDIAYLEELAQLKRKYGAILIVDEAHAFGCIGPNGKGCAAQSGVLHDVDIIIGTLSKALGGAGGFVAGSQVLIDYLINKARPFIFTTAIPAVNCLAADAALDIIADEPTRRERLLANGQYFRTRCKAMSFDTGQSESFIVPIIIGGAQKAVIAASELLKHGFMVPAIRPPTVKRGTSRLRVSLMSEHSIEDIDSLCDALTDVLCDI